MMARSKRSNSCRPRGSRSSAKTILQLTDTHRRGLIASLMLYLKQRNTVKIWFKN